MSICWYVFCMRLHLKSIFNLSIFTKFVFACTAHRCPSYQHFLLGRCFKCNTGNCAVMGYHATLPKIQSFNSSENEVIPSDRGDQVDGGNGNVSVAPGKYFLATGKEYPFCRKHTLFNWLWSIGKISVSFHLRHIFYLFNRTSLPIHNWIGKTASGRTMGTGLYDGINLFRSGSIAWHRFDKGYSTTRARLEISNCHTESTWSGR